MMMRWLNQVVGACASILGLGAGAGALAASSCCALPLALSAAGVSSAWLGTYLGSLAAYRLPLLIAAAILLAIGWGTVLGRRARSCSVDAPGTGRLFVFAVLGTATLLVSTAALWTWIAPVLLPDLMQFARGTS